MGYNVYRSSQPGVTTTPGNLFASVPPSQTQVGSSVGSSGSFFVVTAVYDTGESGPSNELAITASSSQDEVTGPDSRLRGLRRDRVDRRAEPQRERSRS